MQVESNATKPPGSSDGSALRGGDQNGHHCLEYQTVARNNCFAGISKAAEKWGGVEKEFVPSLAGGGELSALPVSAGGR